MRNVQSLQDAAPIMDEATMVAVIEGELNNRQNDSPALSAVRARVGRARLRLSDVYSEFNVEPIAAASLAQVHEARLKETSKSSLER